MVSVVSGKMDIALKKGRANKCSKDDRLGVTRIGLPWGHSCTRFVSEPVVWVGRHSFTFVPTRAGVLQGEEELAQHADHSAVHERTQWVLNK